jgi:hypothetical protein
MTLPLSDRQKIYGIQLFSVEHQHAANRFACNCHKNGVIQITLEMPHRVRAIFWYHATIQQAV